MRSLRLLLFLAAMLHPAWVRCAALINEVILNPPGPDEPNEYIELRGKPNSLLPPGTYLIAVEGDAGGNPGTIQNLFDLSGARLGGNGFLVIAQKANIYTNNPAAALLVHQGNGSGFGFGASSAVHHSGETDQTSLENASVTLFLVTSTQIPHVGDDIDMNNDGAADGALFAAWTIHDSIGVLDADGMNDIAYGAINFRRQGAPGNGATASGTIVEVPFTPDYIGRNGNSHGSAAADWVAGDDLTDGGNARWSLNTSSDTFPTSLAGTAINHLGAPNFGAPIIPGVVVMPWNLTGEEGGTATNYTLALTVNPSGTVTVRIQADPQLEISVNGGTSFATTADVNLNSISPISVQVRVLEDKTVDVSPRARWLVHTIVNTTDATRYPLSTEVAPVAVTITDNDWVLLNEVKMNPPGEDAPFEFIELLAPAGTRLTNTYLLAVDCLQQPGTSAWVLNLSGQQFGANGLLFIGATNHPYQVAPETTLLPLAAFSMTNGVLPNGPTTLLLVASPEAIPVGDDLDRGDNGTLERLPNGAAILDTVTWSNADLNTVTYGHAVLFQNGGIADGASRYPGRFTADDADAWFNGDLFGEIGASVDYNENVASPDFPFGSGMTPGRFNNTAPMISSIQPFSSVIDDPTTPLLTFSVTDQDPPGGPFTVGATSDNPVVVPNERLIVQPLGGGNYTLQIQPVSVGYATILIHVSDGTTLWTFTFPYAASAPGRPETRWLTGIADASAAWPIDANLMLVADDENQILRIYPRQLSGPALNSFNMTPSLNLVDLENGAPREVDIEGCTRVGNRIFWLGSHSHADNAETRTNRATVFATDVSGSGLGTSLTFAGAYRHLKNDLVAWDTNNGHGKGANCYGLALSTTEGSNPKTNAGFNLEGLTMALNSSSVAYLACRAPTGPATNRQFALLIPVLNFTNVVVNDGPLGSATFGIPIELDLFGRGIRSIEADQQGYLIVAGDSGDVGVRYPHDFRLYTWSGNLADLPEERAADLSGLNPEAIVELPPRPWTANSPVQLLSDNGRTLFYGDDVIGKRQPYPGFKKFRSDIVLLGGVVKPKPIILDTRMEGQGVRVWWRARKDESYRLQFKTSLADANWQDLPSIITATGPIAQAFDQAPLTNQRFYQVIAL